MPDGASAKFIFISGLAAPQSGMNGELWVHHLVDLLRHAAKPRSLSVVPNYVTIYSGAPPSLKVNMTLLQKDPAAFQFILDFARTNGLTLSPDHHPPRM